MLDDGYRGRVLRQLRTPKWIGLSLATVVLIVSFGALSYWQWQRANRDRVEQPPAVASAVFVGTGPLDESGYGRRVEATGVYDVAHQVLVRHAEDSFWVVAPLRQTDGVTIPVVRGAVTTPSDPAVDAVPGGVVTVVGVAQPFDGDPGGTPTSLPAGQTDRLTASGLALPYPSAQGWIALQTQDPASTPDMTRVSPPVSADSTGSIRLQNATYAVQWILFAGFVVFFWVRMFRDDLRGAAPVPTPSTPVREVY